MDQLPVETTLYSLSRQPPLPGERRADERHLTLFRVGTMRINDRRELCLIKNISAGGMLVRPYVSLAVGTAVCVELKSGEPIDGVVSWVRGDCAGIAFDQPVDVVELLSASMDGPRPRMPRVEVRCIASVRQGANVYGILARNVSQGGVKLETTHGLAVGSDTVVTLPGLAPSPGVIRWKDGDSYGVTFNRLIALGDLVEWLRNQRSLLSKPE